MRIGRYVPLVAGLLLLCTAGIGHAEQADNSGVNARDRSGTTLTAGDQSNKPADVNLTAAVRQSIVSDANLSMAAHNVKIVAANGVVTLRGPVDSAQEKTIVAEKAKTTAGVLHVDNQLEVVSR